MKKDRNAQQGQGSGYKLSRGFVRKNGRVEARYRPHSKWELKRDEFTIPAFKGFKNGMFKYEWLDYFDTTEEKVAWSKQMKDEFEKRREESNPIKKMETRSIKDSNTFVIPNELDFRSISVASAKLSWYCGKCKSLQCSSEKRSFDCFMLPDHLLEIGPNKTKRGRSEEPSDILLALADDAPTDWQMADDAPTDHDGLLDEFDHLLSPAALSGGDPSKKTQFQIDFDEVVVEL